LGTLRRGETRKSEVIGEAGYCSGRLTPWPTNQGGAQGRTIALEEREGKRSGGDFAEKWSKRDTKDANFAGKRTSTNASLSPKNGWEKGYGATGSKDRRIGETRKKRPYTYC